MGDIMKARIKLGGNNFEVGHSVIDMELKETDKGLCFSASGLQNYQYDENGDDYDYQSGGQCLDSIAKDYPDNKDLQTIVKLWKKHHLNDMNAGTPRQTKHIKSLGEYKSYEWACEELEKADMLFDKEYNYPNQKGGYKYGSAWLYREMPDKDIKEIKVLIKKYNN
jgi:hypothetical protein